MLKKLLNIFTKKNKKERKISNINILQLKNISGSSLFNEISNYINKNNLFETKYNEDENSCSIISKLDENDYKYVKLSSKIIIDDLSKKYKLKLKYNGNIELSGCIIFFDENSQRIGHSMFYGEFVNLVVPSKINYAFLYIRVSGNGAADNISICVDHTVSSEINFQKSITKSVKPEILGNQKDNTKRTVINKKNIVDNKLVTSLLLFINDKNALNNEEVVFKNLYIPKNNEKTIIKDIKNKSISLTSYLKNNEHAYIDVFKLNCENSENSKKNQKFFLRLAYEGNLDIQGALIFNDKNSKEISSPIFFTKNSVLVDTSLNNLFTLSLKLRIKGVGSINNFKIIKEDYPYNEIYISNKEFGNNCSIPKLRSEKIKIENNNNLYKIISTLDEGEKDYVSLRNVINIDDYPRKIQIKINQANNPQIIYCITTYDSEDKKIENIFVSKNITDAFISNKAKTLKVSIRLVGRTSCTPSMTIGFSDALFQKCSNVKIDEKKILEELKKEVDIQLSLLKNKFNDKIKNITYGELNNLLNSVKVACIMDEFTWKSYSPEANMIQLLPECYEQQLLTFKPDMIFVESAWRGYDNKWTNVIHKIPKELLHILSIAKKQNIPTVFWNKEDPIHFDTFKNVAILFDFIFTYDFNCVQKYKSLTKKNNAFFLPMAVQPLMFNPIEKYNRVDAFCFAGSYYKKYIERSEDFDKYIDVLPTFKNIDIYDRQFFNDDPNYMFPEKYKPYIKGNLPYDEMDKAYKGYDFSINLNSIKQANSIARRVFELLACNTITVSNYSYGVRKGFGDLVITTDSPSVMIEKIKNYSSFEYGLDKFKLLGLRKIFSENTYRDRFSYICSKILGINLNGTTPSVALIARVSNKNQAKICENMVKNFNYNNKELFLISSHKALKARAKKDFSQILPLLKDYDYVGMIDHNDFYAQNYLSDLVNAFKYSLTDSVVKGTYFSLNDSKLELKGESATYTYVDYGYLTRGLVSVDFFVRTINEKKLSMEDYSYSAKTLSLDKFNYCCNGNLHKIEKNIEQQISDLQDIDTGWDFSEMQRIAENMEIPQNSISSGTEMLANEIYDYVSKYNNTERYKKINMSFVDNKVIVESLLATDEHIYIPIDKEFLISELKIYDHNKLHLFFEIGYKTNIQIRIAYYFYDGNKQKIFSKVDSVNSDLVIEIPKNSVCLKIQLRIQNSGFVELKSLKFSHVNKILPYYFDNNRILCVSNAYPSYKSLYRNGFIHARLKLYREKHVNVTVFVLENEVMFDEFEGIDVIRGNSVYLCELLANHHFSKILVHFLDENIWDCVKRSNSKIITWIHGSEIQKYNRRLYNFNTKEELEKGIVKSNEREVLWNKIFSQWPNNLHFVIVSNYFKNEIEEDYKIKIPRDKYSVIHNPINTSIFKYEKKDISQRYNILSIRPFASNKYANDLSVKCILELSKRSDFEKFNITIIGDGALFDELLAPLKNFSNVHIYRKFLTQNEIYEFHKKNGLFLVPTRMDAQGVSRDEAMSSGLIPVTNAVTAIPEFVDENCGILAPEEDYVEMANGISRVVDSPNLFSNMSEAAAIRVRNQTASSVVIDQELLLIKG